MKLHCLTLFNNVVLLILLNITNNSAVAQRILTDTARINKKDTISIIAVGDIMLGSAYPVITNLPPDDAKNSFKHVNSFLKGDIIFGNLEGCFLNSGKSTKCKDTIGNTCFAFRMPERYAAIYKDAGFNLLSIANNHIGDFGLRGRKRTTAILDSLGIQYAGLISHPFTFFEKDSIKYAFCAFAPNENTISINQLDSVKSLIKRLKQKADIVIVSFHGGGEGAIDAGADVVLGHGPHVTRAVEVYKNKFIAYSLGNFCTYGRFNLKGPNGFAPLLQLKINNKGDFLYADIISVKQNKIKRLTVDLNCTAFKRMAQLTSFDFPGNKLIFSGKGHIN